jgi:hypothetical protein
MSKNTEKNFPSFVLIPVGKTQTLINLGQIRMIDSIREGQCRLVFSESFKPTLKGPAADELVAQLISNALPVDGTSTLDVWERLGEQP